MCERESERGSASQAEVGVNKCYTPVTRQFFLIGWQVSRYFFIRRHL